MRRGRILHMVCSALLVVAPTLFMQACSSAEEDDGDLEGQQFAENAEGAENVEGANENFANGNNAEGDNEYAMDSEVDNFNGEQGNLAFEDGANNQLLDGQQTQNDLENIIAGQNADASEGNMVEAAPVDESIATADPMATGNMATPAIEQAMVSAGPALPEQGSKMPYIVRVGDSLSSIAKMIYGSADRWSDMAELSAIKNPNLVRPGDVVYYQLTQETLAFATAYEGAPRNELTVQAGDTLARIAEKVYGNAGDWKFVWRQNADISNPDRLEIGQTLYYLTPATLSAALDYAKSVSLASLIGKTSTEDKQESNNVNAPIQTIDQQVSNSNVNTNTVTGFELAADMFNVFSVNFLTANFAAAG